MNELEELKFRVETLELQIQGLLTVFEQQMKINDTLSERISNVSNRLHEHLMKPETLI